MYRQPVHHDDWEIRIEMYFIEVGGTDTQLSSVALDQKEGGTIL